MGDKNWVKAYALDAIREYLIINDVEINGKQDFVALYLKMRKEGYFYKADLNDALDIVRDVLGRLADAYEKDKNIIESDLIFRGSGCVLEKLEAPKTKR